MRDIDGKPMIAIFFPFFPRGKTRQQLLAHKTKVQVKSCWNGMGTIHPPQHLQFMLIIVSLNAVPFQNETLPLRFRAISKSLSLQNGYLEGSEACLIHADMQAHWQNLPVSPGRTYLNTLVRVSYTASAFAAQNSIFQIFMERVVGYIVAWAYDIRDWCVQCRLARHSAERKEKIRGWERITGEREVGEYCLNDQMQLLTPSGWAHF
jgi:Cryptococcal mannosyltransferase 1